MDAGKLNARFAAHKEKAACVQNQFIFNPAIRLADTLVVSMYFNLNGFFRFPPLP